MQRNIAHHSTVCNPAQTIIRAPTHIADARWDSTEYGEEYISLETCDRLLAQYDVLTESWAYAFSLRLSAGFLKKTSVAF